MIITSDTGGARPVPAPPVPSALEAVFRGVRGRCPACGEGRLFGRFLKVAPSCSACGQDFHHHRADDFPPYIVMFVVGHIVGYGIYVSETRFEDVPLWLHAVLWPSLAVGLSLGLLQPVKGAVIGWQYGLGMHGFGHVPGPSGETAIERRAWGTPEAGDGVRGSTALLAEPAAAGRRDPDHPRQVH
ncbi:DUF983 domain-containing protein [uncultured Enterovirga sp.]|uniref:DUF983 domain-containing protein n=1 Tax=uncultured Enterovirga sp. TaxID=2026352 RepID=UPI0035CB5C1D